jgi:hypothetical protein
MIEYFDVIIIGAGPAGMFTAININSKYSTLIVEKNSLPGRKLLLAGSGRCNITNIGEIHDFSKHYGKNFRYIKNAILSFTNTDLIKFLNSNGINTVVDKNGKVFPESQKSKDILDILIKKCQEKNVRFSFNNSMDRVEKVKEKFIIKTNSNIYNCKYLVIATGGITYQKTGSTGDGYDIALSFGHSIVKPKPALTPIFIKDYKFNNISGVSLVDRQILLFRNNKKIMEHTGDIGFTHKGLSGPGILDFSRYFEIDDTVKVNILNLNSEKFSEQILKALKEESKSSIKKLIKTYFIPESLIIAILQSINVDPSTQLANLKKSDRIKIIEYFCSYPFTIEKMGGAEIAMVTSGGISFKEINTNTMESKIVKNLFFAGEVLDIDGDTGGYNLQSAFSTGYLVAKNL